MLRLLLARLVGMAHLAIVAFILTRATPTSALILSNVQMPAPAAVVVSVGVKEAAAARVHALGGEGEAPILAEEAAF